MLDNFNGQPPQVPQNLNFEQAIKQQVLGAFDEKKDAVFKALVEDKRSYCQHIPEQIFVNNFLPYMLGERQDNANWVVEWIAIAGSPSAEVCVVDPYDKTKELFYVPPLFNTQLVGSNSGPKYSTLLERYQQYNDNSPYLGMSFLNDELSKKASAISQQGANPQAQEYKAMWDFILLRYRPNASVQPAGIPQQGQDNSLDSLMA